MKIIKPKYGVQKFQSHYVYLNMRKIIAEHLLMVYLRLKRLFFFSFSNNLYLYKFTKVNDCS